MDLVGTRNVGALTELGTRNIKIIILIALFVLTTIFCFLPQIVIFFSSKYENTDIPLSREEQRTRRRRKRFRKNAVSLMNCFASGVFLGVCLLDLLPEVEENLGDFISTYMVDVKFPLSQFSVVIGFLLLLLLEQVATLCKKDVTNPFTHHHHHGGGIAESLMSSTASTIPTSIVDSYQHHLHHHHSHHQQPQPQPLNDSILNLAPSHFASQYVAAAAAAVSAPNDTAVDGYDNVDINSISIPNHHTQHCHHHHHHQDHHEISPNGDDDENTTTETSHLLPKPDDEDIDNLAEIEEAEIERKEVPTDPRAHSNVRYVMLAIALSVHSIFEGLALGLEPKISSVFQLFMAIAIHKCVVAFSFGLNMSQSSLNICTKFSSLIVFCLASPIGAIIGLGIGMVSFDKGTAGGIIGSLQGLACGSFIYVVFFELLPHEFFTFRKRPSPLLKVLALILGITLMSGVMLIEPV